MNKGTAESSVLEFSSTCATCFAYYFVCSNNDCTSLSPDVGGKKGTEV